MERDGEIAFKAFEQTISALVDSGIQPAAVIGALGAVTVLVYGNYTTDEKRELLKEMMENCIRDGSQVLRLPEEMN